MVQYLPTSQTPQKYRIHKENSAKYVFGQNTTQKEHTEEYSEPVIIEEPKKLV